MLEEGLTSYITAAAGLGTAAFALVDGSKAMGGGVSNCGFGHVERVIARLFHGPGVGPEMLKSLRSSKVVFLIDIRSTLRANWLNGTPLENQISIAKSLVKLNLNEATVPALAEATAVDPEKLALVARAMATGEELDPQLNNVFGRFDLMLTALLDEAYHRADQAYRNSAKAWSIVVSVLLALVGVFAVFPEARFPDPDLTYIGKALLLGLLATPIAPMAKDLTSAISAGVKVAQTLRK